MIPNIRDYVSAEELVVLINLEDTNADLIRQGLSQLERLKILRDKAYRQLHALRNNFKLTGIQLANMYGFTTQNPACIEVCSNEATTKQRKVDIDGRRVIVYKPVAKNNPSAQLEYNIPNMLKEIIQSRFYESDYRNITQKLLYEDIYYTVK